MNMRNYPNITLKTEIKVKEQDDYPTLHLRLKLKWRNNTFIADLHFTVINLSGTTCLLMDCGTTCLPMDWNDMSTHGLMLQWASSAIKIQLNMLVYYKTDIIIILLKCNLFSPFIAENCSFGIKQQSLTHIVGFRLMAPYGLSQHVSLYFDIGIFYINLGAVVVVIIW
jgi:hypothetical protein